MPRIEEMYAFVAEDSGPDDEGVVGMATGSGWVPLERAIGIEKPKNSERARALEKPKR